MSDHVQQIKDRLSIVDVVSSYVKVEKAGINFRAKCPFHNEKTPSFFVSPERNTFHCFGCSAGGDVFAFVERFEGTDFKGALKILADRAGVTLTPLDPKKEDARARLYGVLEAAAGYFEATYKKNPEASTYLKGRGMSEKSVTLWRIGYAEAQWHALEEHLTKVGYTRDVLVRAGLVKKGEKGKHYDTFRGRIMFPITDTSGRVVAFTGRILPDKRNSEYKEDTAKYLNSPETELFHKSHVLFGFSLAKLPIRRMNFSILVEGQMDVIMAHQAGYTNTTAASGTALTSDQLSLLARLSNNIVMAFDADSAGVTAQGKGIDLALARGMDVKIAAIPKGSDPADLIKEDKEAWRLAVKGAKHVIDFYLDHLGREYTDMRKLRLAVSKTVIPYIARIPHRIDQAHFVAETAKRLGISEAPIWESVRERGRKETDAPARRTEYTPHTPREDGVTRQERILSQLIALLFLEEARAKDEREIDTAAVRQELEARLGKEELQKELEQCASEGDTALYELEVQYGTIDRVRLAEELLQEWKREHLKREYEAALTALRSAEAAGGAEEVKDALERCRLLSAALRES